jgi:uncharacterized protein
MRPPGKHSGQPCLSKNLDAVNMVATNVSGKIIVSGASGMLGTALRRALDARGVQILQLLRRPPAAEGQLQWDPNSEQPVSDPASLEGSTAAIHLSGAGVGEHRWTKKYQSEMAASRVDSTRRLATTLASLRKPPRCFLVASAVGIYGDRGNELLQETSSTGSGFLAGLCQQWEAAAYPAVEAGIRVVHLRFGVVLGPSGGALAQMLTPFRVGLGAKLGDGRQWMSWIALEDTIAAVLFLLAHTEISGPVNVTAPNPVTNADFTKALGRQLRRPAFLAIPRFGLRLMFGTMADETLLASARVKPARLLNAGFSFSFPKIDESLETALGSSR